MENKRSKLDSRRSRLDNIVYLLSGIIIINFQAKSNSNTSQNNSRFYWNIQYIYLNCVEREICILFIKHNNIFHLADEIYRPTTKSRIHHRPINMHQTIHIKGN